MAKKAKTNGKTNKPQKVKTAVLVNALVDRVRSLEDRIEVLENYIDTETHEEPTVATLSAELGISPSTLREWLRTTFPRPASELYKPWGTLTQEMVEAARGRYISG